jgi:hypothetical protein
MIMVPYFQYLQRLLESFGRHDYYRFNSIRNGRNCASTFWDLRPPSALRALIYPIRPSSIEHSEFDENDGSFWRREGRVREVSI